VNYSRLLSVPFRVLSSVSTDRFFRQGARLFVAGAIAGLVGCDKPPVPPTSDTTAVVAIPDSIVVSKPNGTVSTWNADAGPFLILPTVDGGMLSGSLIRPGDTDATVGDTVGIGRDLGRATVDLFARSGAIGTATVRVEKALVVDSGCTAWPVARLSPESGGARIMWTVAFASGRIAPISLDSIEGLSPRDSARLAVDLTRLASGLADDTVPTFRGLPFVVLRAWRSRDVDAGFVVATLVRRVNQEDSPREERLVMVVDVRNADAKQWQVAWSERASGREEELVVAEPLLAYRMVSRTDSTSLSNTVQLLFGRDDGVALSAAVLRRGASGWHVQWESAIAGCM
jgi:hypothetical protein